MPSPNDQPKRMESWSRRAARSFLAQAAAQKHLSVVVNLSFLKIGLTDIRMTLRDKRCVDDS